MLYTGKGDGGTTKMFDSPSGVRLSKSSELPEALGTLDELNAFIGFVKMRVTDNLKIAKELRIVQEKLFIVQAEVAGADKRLKREDVTHVEEVIAQIEKEIPPVTGFCVAGGTELSALLDVARTLSRRAERRVVAIDGSGIRKIETDSLAYMNRLSSLLFALARLANHLEEVQEENPKYE